MSGPYTAQPPADRPKLRRRKQGIGGGARLLVPPALLLGSFALGLWVFNREAPRVAEEL